MQEIWDQLLKTTWIELVAMLSGLLFPIFSAYEKKICWLFGFISSGIYVYICYSAKLYQDAILSVYYVVMSVVGFLIWQGVIKSKKENVKISYVKHGLIMVYLLVGILYAGLGGYFFHQATDASYPYVDGFVVGFCLVATFLDAKKKIENWYLFFVADGVAVWLFYQKGLLLTALLNIIYCFICIYGIIQWRRKIKLSKLL